MFDFQETCFVQRVELRAEAETGSGFCTLSSGIRTARKWFLLPVFGTEIAGNRFLLLGSIIGTTQNWLPF